MAFWIDAKSRSLLLERNPRWIAVPAAKTDEGDCQSFFSLRTMDPRHLGAK
jgi:hypothetical protein